MKHSTGTPHRRRFPVCAVALLVLSLLWASPPAASGQAVSQNTAAPQATDKNTAIEPAAAQAHPAPDADLRVEGELRTDRPVTVVFDLKGYDIPAGAYASINVRFLEKPDGAAPLVRAGYPQTVLTFDRPGLYRTTFILNEVSKPSCGGVNARTLLEQTVDLHVLQ